MKRKDIKNSCRYYYGKVLQYCAVNALEENHVSAFSHKLVPTTRKKMLHKRISGGLLLNMFQKQVQT